MQSPAVVMRPSSSKPHYALRLSVCLVPTVNPKTENHTMFKIRGEVTDESRVTEDAILGSSCCGHWAGNVQIVFGVKMYRFRYQDHTACFIYTMQQ